MDINALIEKIVTIVLMGAALYYSLRAEIVEAKNQIALLTKDVNNNKALHDETTGRLIKSLDKLEQTVERFSDRLNSLT